MFTGLIESVGVVTLAQPFGTGRRFHIRPGFPVSELTLGESVACDGCCLTVTAVATDDPSPGEDTFSVDVSPETLARTTLSEWAPGRRVNLERAMRADGRFGGHIVLGHVDAVGEIVARRSRGDFTDFFLRIPAEMMPLVVEKGSLACDGISLTVNEMDDHQSEVRLTLIPHTLAHTTWGLREVGARVHLEADALAKHVKRLLATTWAGIGSARPE